MYAVTVAGGLAKRGPGTRRRAGLEFRRDPLYLSEVPAAVEADPHLEVDKLSAAEWKKLEAQGARETQVPPTGDAQTPAATVARTRLDVPMTPFRQAEIERIREAIANVGPKTAEVLVRAGYGLEDTRQSGSLRHVPVEDLVALGLQPAQVKAIAAWQAATKPDLSEVEAQVKAASEGAPQSDLPEVEPQLKAERIQ